MFVVKGDHQKKCKMTCISVLLNIKYLLLMRVLAGVAYDVFFIFEISLLGYWYEILLFVVLVFGAFCQSREQIFGVVEIFGR